MRRPELWAELMKLSKAERIKLAQDLWDTIKPEDLPPLSADQINELERHLAEHHRDPSTAIPWEEVKARLFARYK
jgi:putative addiction module component (TIGR02574 family)